MNQPKSIGILTYDTTNLGDWTQTAAALHVWWTFFNKPTTFTQFVKNCIQTSSMESIPITWIQRDTIELQVKPDGIDKVIILCNGWWMHKKDTYAFVTPDWIVPIYTSIHITNRDMLTPSVIEHLQRYAPIGCRDASTAQLCRKHGIDAYFSGCITMLLDLHDPLSGLECTEDFSSNELHIDILLRMNVQPSKPLLKRTQHHNELGELYNIIRVIQDTYNYMHAARIVTARLHVWLPLATNGANVILMSKHTNLAFKNGDKDNESEEINRFAGLTEIVYNTDSVGMFKKGLLADTLQRIERVFF